MSILSYVSTALRQSCFLALSILFLITSCSKEDALPQAEPSVGQGSVGLDLSSELELEDEAFRSLVMTSKGSKPMVNLEKSSWNGHLFFRKKGATGVVAYVNLTWQVQRDARTNKIKLSYSGSPTFQNAAALPALGETWYVAAVLGSGTLSADKQSIDFAAGAVQETPEGIAEGLDVPFMSNWTPLTITRAPNGSIQRKANFSFRPLGTIHRVEIKNTTNYDFRIYRNEANSGSLNPVLPRIFYRIWTEDMSQAYQGLKISFANQQAPEASLENGRPAIEFTTVSFSSPGPYYEPATGSVGIMPNKNHPLTLKAETGSFAAVLWNYIPKGKKSKVQFYGGQLFDMSNLFNVASIRKSGTTDNSLMNSIEVNANTSDWGRSVSYKLDLFRRPSIAIDYLLTEEEERRYGADFFIQYPGVTPLDYAYYPNSRYDLPGQHSGITLFRTDGMSQIFPIGTQYISEDRSGTPSFRKSSPEDAEYPFGQDYVKTGVRIGDIFKGVARDNAIYAIRNRPVSADGSLTLFTRSYGSEVGANTQKLYLQQSSTNAFNYTDGDQQVAMRYQYQSGSLKVTVRYLGNASTATIDDIANPGFWSNDPKGLNIVYTFPETRTYLKYGAEGGSFLGFNQNIPTTTSTIQIYHMTHHGFSEWGIWSESYHSDTYPRASGPIRYQSLDDMPFGTPHFVHPHLVGKALK